VTDDVDDLTLRARCDDTVPGRGGRERETKSSASEESETSIELIRGPHELELLRGGNGEARGVEGDGRERRGPRDEEARLGPLRADPRTGPEDRPLCLTLDS
jgi:hypothetical protein